MISGEKILGKNSGEVEKFARRMARELKRAEWNGSQGYFLYGRGCPWCDDSRESGHRVDCEWLVLMAEAKRLGLLEADGDR
jgi:hypothetical protein